MNEAYGSTFIVLLRRTEKPLKALKDAHDANDLSTHLRYSSSEKVCTQGAYLCTCTFNAGAVSIQTLQKDCPGGAMHFGVIFRRFVKFFCGGGGGAIEPTSALSMFDSSYVILFSGRCLTKCANHVYPS